MSTLFRRFFDRLPVRAVSSDGHLHLLSPDELRNLRRSHRIAVATAAGLSVMGFLLYFLPVYSAPELFPSVPITLFGQEIVFPWAETLWGLLLMVIEIYLLVLLNLWGVHTIAVETGLMGAHNKANVAEAMMDIGLENKHKGLLQYGIDPFLGLNPIVLFAVNAVLKLKGWLGSKILRYAVQRLLGRFAVREVLDFIGMPIYMAINAWSTHSVLREATVIIMGQKLIEHLGRRMPDDLCGSTEDRALLFDTFRFIAVSKRDFHQNHFLLTKTLIEKYRIEVAGEKGTLGDYLGRLAAARAPLRRACVMLIVIGFVLDGQLSLRERRRIRLLAERGVFEYSAQDVARWCRDFVRGEGIEGLLTAQLGAARATEWVRPSGGHAAVGGSVSTGGGSRP